MIRTGDSLTEAVKKFLFDYRTTPHATTGVSPASLLYKRELRTRFSLLRPRVTERVEQQQEAQIKNSPRGRKNNFEIGEKVRARDYEKNNPEWSEAIITENKTPVTHVVYMDGKTCKRHSNQMKKCSQGIREPPPSETRKEEEESKVPRRSKRLAVGAQTKKGEE